MKTRFYLTKCVLLIAITCIININYLFAQNPVWVLPPYYTSANGVTIQQTPLPTPSGLGATPDICYQGQSAEHVANGIALKDGSLFFFIVDEYIYNGQGICIGILTDEYIQGLNYNPNAKGHAELVIVPVPSSNGEVECGKFYIFTSNSPSNLSTVGLPQPKLVPYYAILDMTQPSGQNASYFGKLTDWNGTPNEKTVQILPLLPSISQSAKGFPIHLAAVKAADNENYLLFVQRHTKLLRYKVTASGVFLDNTLADGGIVNTPTIEGDYYMRNEMEVVKLTTPLSNNAYYKLAFSAELGGEINEKIIYLELDANGESIISASKVMSIPIAPSNSEGHFIKGLEFSSSGNWLYCNYSLTNQELNNTALSPIVVYDVSNLGISQPLYNQMNCNGCTNVRSYHISQIEMDQAGVLNLTNGFNWLQLNATAVENPLSNLNAWTSTANLIYPYSQTNGYLTSDMQSSTGSGTQWKLYSLPDQNDGDDYSSYLNEGTVSCCQAFQKYYTNASGGYDISITSTTMGNQLALNDLKFNGTVTIYPGVTLDLITKTWEFGPNGKIVVMPKAILTLDKSVLKAVDCDVMWKGVEVWGNSAMPQNTNNQGYMSMKNNSIITLALAGVTARNTTNYIYGCGGIIRATDSYFIDNKIDVDISNYINSSFNNLCRFSRCTFKSEKPLPYPHQLVRHVYLYNVNTVFFEQCHFECAYFPSNNYAPAYGIGIQALDAKFNVKGNCNLINSCDLDNMNACTFNNLYIGINAIRLQNSKTYWVDRCFFNNCMTGIENRGVDKATIIRNKFELGSFPVFGANFGINLQRGTGFIIEENRMKQTNNYGKHFTGILAYDNTPVGDDNRIYNNAFYNMEIANMSNYSNRSDNNIGINPFHGLQYYCNYNENTGFGYFDFVVRGDGQGQNQGIRLYQGGNSIGGIGGAAGNIFSHRDAIINESDFYQFTDEVGSVVYYQYAPGGVPDPAQECVDYSGNITPVDTPDDNEFSCKLNYGTSPLRMFTNGELEVFEQEFESLAAAKSITVNNLNSLIDAGNTFQLLNNVDNTNSNASEELKYQLLNSSPFLSDEVIKEASNKTWVLNNFTVMQLFFANPDAARKKTLVEYLATKDDPMATWMIDAIKENATAASARTSLESTIAAYNSRQNEIVTRVVASILMDTLPVDSTLFTKWANKLNSPSGDYMLVENLLYNGQTTAANNILNQVPEKYNLSVEEISKHIALMSIYNLSSVLKASNRDASQLKLEEIASLQNIAKGKRCLAKTMANNILELNGVEPEIEEVLYPEKSTEERRSNSKNNGAINAFSGYELKTYPNPANEQLTIELTDGMFFLNLINAQGQLVYEYAQSGNSKINIDTKQFTDGIYLLRVLNKNEVVLNDKITIKH